MAKPSQKSGWLVVESSWLPCGNMGNDATSEQAVRYLRFSWQLATGKSGQEQGQWGFPNWRPALNIQEIGGSMRSSKVHDPTKSLARRIQPSMEHYLWKLNTHNNIF